MNKLFEVMIFCIDKDYIRAHDKYIELAIGNAPWPMGVTMVGIHERSGRSRIYTSQVAHILNDENTKKYLQSVKRIMSLVQRIYPASPSNCVYS
jgi:pre-mRNA-splicing factor 18